MRKLVLINIFIALLLTLNACSEPQYDLEVVDTIVSPSNTYKVVIVKYNYDTTVPLVYRVFLLKPNEDPKSTDLDFDYFRTDDIQQTKITWLDDSTVSIECTPGKIYKFNNFGYAESAIFKVHLKTQC